MNLQNTFKPNNQFNSNIFNTNTSHPLIPNSQEYIHYKKYVSIHSEDRNIIKYPDSSEFEIEVPEDLLNVASLRLVDWTFPSNYNTFSLLNNNTVLTFQINAPYNTNENGVGNLLYQKIFEYLFYNQTQSYEVRIQDGFYNPQQMVTELTNKFNSVINNKLIDYFTTYSTDTSKSQTIQDEYTRALNELKLMGGYSNFVIVYDNVSQKIWFGNRCDGFVLTNETRYNQENSNLNCGTPYVLPNFSDWGLPGNLGLSRKNTYSSNQVTNENSPNLAKYNDQYVPRFYYGDVFPGDEGYWLLPNQSLTNSQVQWVEATTKINLMGKAYMYMELEGQNCIDETSPYNLSEYTSKTNSTNGVVNSSFAKIAIPTTPMSQWFDENSLPYKFYYPPAERMRKFHIKMRYHNGELVNFGNFNYSFVIEFTLQLPQILRSSVKTLKW